MIVCNPAHPNCLKQSPASGARFCAGCGRSATEVAAESSVSAPAAEESDVGDPLVVQALDVVSDVDDVGDSNVSSEAADSLEDFVFADSSPDSDDSSDSTDLSLPAGGDAANQVSTGVASGLDPDAVPSDPGAVILPASLGGGLLNIAPPSGGPAILSVSLQDALAQLRSWASRWQVLSDPYVSGLSAAISKRDDLTMWASLSPRENLPRPSASSRFGWLSFLGRILNLVRNVLVFVPVALTWFAIGKASEAYGQFTQDNPDTPLNFLQFWQSGQYGGKQYLSAFWRIGDVARFDALLIGLIVILTLVVGAAAGQIERSEAKFEDASESERLALSIVLSNALHGRRSASPESIGESLAEALNDLTQAARDVNDVASRLERATVGVDALGPKLDVLNQHTDRLVGQSVQSITASMSALVTSVGQLNGAVSSNVTQVFADTTANLEEVSAQFSRIASSMEVGVAQLREDLEHISRNLTTGNRGNRQ
jgi:hypothetical protein